MKSSFVVLLLLVAFISCKKASIISDESGLEKKASKFLSERMSAADFSVLDWKQVWIENVNGQPGLLKIKHKYERHKILLFGEIDDVAYANWVEVNVLRKERGKIDATVILRDLKNKLLNKIEAGWLSNNSGRGSNNLWQGSDALTGRFNGDPGDLPPFTVTGYTNNDPSPWWSLYWLFSGSLQWFGQYTNNAFLDPSCTNCFGGSDVLSIDELYPETPEILLFEHDYLGLMTAEEAQIYHAMSRGNQLKYLWNAKRASDVAQVGFQPPYFNGKSDAFRHAYFSALNAHALGIELATALGNAHENRPGNPALETEMDLRNNAIGRNVYLMLLQLNLGSHFFKEGLGIKINEMIKNGELWYLSPLQANGQIIPGVTQLIPTNQ